MALALSSSTLPLLLLLLSPSLAIIDPHSCPRSFSCLTVYETVQFPSRKSLCGLGPSSPPCADGSNQQQPLCNVNTFDCTDTGRVACPAYPSGNTTVVCIDPSLMCNGIPDCFGATDEDSTLCTQGTPGAFNCSLAGKRWCPSGTGCVQEGDLCDGVTMPASFSGCADGSDESPSFCQTYTCPAVMPILPDRVLCPHVDGVNDTHQCISASTLCDGVPNCHDGSQDENPTFCTSFNCTSVNKRKCPGGQGCLYEVAMCDGHVDCQAGNNNITDESDCKSYNCSLTNRISCPDGSNCINSETQLCNGVPDCPPYNWTSPQLSSDEDPGFCAAYDCSKSGRRKCPGKTSKNICISEDNFCDGKPDCPDGSDEKPKFCKKYDCSKSGRGKCKKGPPFCIPLSGMCNTTKECKGGSDESPSVCKHFNCSRDGRVSCPSGIHCIDSPVALCDGQPDCSDKSDEDPSFCRKFNCPATNRTLCPSGVGCLPFGSQCDGVVDCMDGSDEARSFCRTFSCSNLGSWKCRKRRSQCISPDRVCDGVVDCADSSDESVKLCKSINCKKFGKVKCPRLQGHPPQCVLLEDFCNGTPDCPGGMDEAPFTNCANFTCPFGTIKCAANNTCTPGFLCNGLPEDCQCAPEEKAYDEEPGFCSAYQCPNGFVKCKDQKQCIQEIAVCDGRTDCVDKSDEDPGYCSTYDCAASKRAPCPGGGGYCISSSCSLCDGINDCPQVPGKYLSNSMAYYPDEDPAFCNLRSPVCPTVPSVSSS